MILTLSILAVVVAVLLVVVSFVQQLYLDSLRLRARELPALCFFKETLEARFGYTTEAGAMAFSLIKHVLLSTVGIIVYGLTSEGKPVSPATIISATVFAIVLMFVTAYIVPQVLYRRTLGVWVLSMVPVLKLLVLLTKPVAVVLNFLQSIFELGQPEAAHDEAANSTENIEALITAGTEEGIIEEEDRKLIHSVVAFGDKTVREVMTPRPNIVAVSQDKTLEELRQLVINEQYSRIPVFADTIDHVVGFIHVRDLFELKNEDLANRTAKELARPIRFVPETKPVTDLLREMQQDGAHMVIVVDEYGNTAGLATLEDVVEEILGEIHDEHEPARDVHEEPNGAFVVSGSYDLDHLYDLLDFRPQEHTESTTVGGLITEWLGRVPQVGETVDREGIHIEVLAANELRVEKVRIAKSLKDAHVGNAAD